MLMPMLDSDSASPVISFNQVTKSFYLQHQKTLKEMLVALMSRKKTRESITALKDISFQINKGESIGVIGKNGAGKSTLLKMIAGVSQPTFGKVSVSGRLIPLIELGAGFHPELTGQENIFLNASILGMSRHEVKLKYKQIVDFSELGEFLDTPVKFYSSGMYMRLAFSVAVSLDPEILLVDEMLAVGDLQFQQKCLQRMKEFRDQGVTIIFVGHSMETMKEFCTRVLYLKEGHLQYDGVTNEAIKQYLTDISLV